MLLAVQLGNEGPGYAGIAPFNKQINKGHQEIDFSRYHQKSVFHLFIITSNSTL